MVSTHYSAWVDRIIMTYPSSCAPPPPVMAVDMKGSESFESMDMTAGTGNIRVNTYRDMRKHHP